VLVVLMMVTSLCAAVTSGNHQDLLEAPRDGPLGLLERICGGRDHNVGRRKRCLCLRLRHVRLLLRDVVCDSSSVLDARRFVIGHHHGRFRQVKVVRPGNDEAPIIGIAVVGAKVVRGRLRVEHLGRPAAVPDGSLLGPALQMVEVARVRNVRRRRNHQERLARGELERRAGVRWIGGGTRRMKLRRSNDLLVFVVVVVVVVVAAAVAATLRLMLQIVVRSRAVALLQRRTRKGSASSSSPPVINNDGCRRRVPHGGD
jgi:hypothetical protein